MMEPERRKYVGASLPGWLVAIIVALVLYRMADLPLWAGALLVAGWIAADLVTFPRRRRFYTSEPARRRIVGERGVAASDVSSQGFVRVHGELWQARAADPAAVIREGEGIRVREIHGLELVVDR